MSPVPFVLRMQPANRAYVVIVVESSKAQNEFALRRPSFTAHVCGGMRAIH